jgi:putative transposase
MNKDNVVAIKKPERFVDDPISDILRQGARDLLAHALEAEIEIFLNQYKDLRDETGLQRIVRNGYLPERQIQTGIGPVPVEVPRTGIGLCRNRKGYPSVQPYCRLTCGRPGAWNN